jgi:hypothetical protein
MSDYFKEITLGKDREVPIHIPFHLLSPTNPSQKISDFKAQVAHSNKRLQEVQAPTLSKCFPQLRKVHRTKPSRKVPSRRSREAILAASLVMASRNTTQRRASRTIQERVQEAQGRLAFTGAVVING